VVGIYTRGNRKLPTSDSPFGLPNNLSAIDPTTSAQ